MLDNNQPTALPSLICSDFITYILRSHKAPTTLIICSSRETFIAQLRTCLIVDERSTPSTSQTEQTSKSLHPLLIPTLNLIAKSRSINLAFASTLPHLRAFLTTYAPLRKAESTLSTLTNCGSQTPILAIWGIAQLHRSTAEHSAQGLSRTLATAVEAARTGVQRLILAEPKEPKERPIDEDTNDMDEGLDDPWKEQVPLLSGSVRFGGEERAWAGRTIEVGRVVAKWCRFVKPDY